MKHCKLYIKFQKIKEKLCYTHREVASIVLDSFWSDEAANREPCGTVRLVALHDGIAPGHRHVVDHPLVHVALVDALTEEL